MWFINFIMVLLPFLKPAHAVVAWESEQVPLCTEGTWLAFGSCRVKAALLRLS